MSQYTETKQGFQNAMELCLTGDAKDVKSFVESYAAPEFYHIMNDTRYGYGDYVKSLEEWRSKASEYKPVVDEFLRDGDRLACHMKGTIKLDGADTVFESFMFAKVDPKSGRLEHLVERAIWGPAGAV